MIWHISFFVSTLIPQIPLLNPRFSLKQEEEKRLRAEMQYEKMREQLRRKEDQYCRETEERQQLELHARNLETELITLRKLMKQVSYTSSVFLLLSN